MRRLWKRLVRLAGQSRISLPRSTLVAGDIRPGDWIQIESRVWRVGRCSHDNRGVLIELVSLRGNALLREGVSCWTFCHPFVLEIPADSIIIYHL